MQSVVAGLVAMPGSKVPVPDLLSEQDPSVLACDMVALLLVDRASFKVLAANEAASRLYGLTLQNLLSLHLQELFDPQDWPYMRTALQVEPALPTTGRNWLQRGNRGAQLQVMIETASMDLGGVPAFLLTIRHGDSGLQQRQEDADIAALQSFEQERTEDGIIGLDADARLVLVNHQAEQLLRRVRKDLLGKIFWDCFPQAVASEHYFHYTMALQGFVPRSYEAFCPSLQAWHEVRLYSSARGISVHFRDATQRHEALWRIGHERDRLNAIVNVSNDAIISVNAQGAIQTFNPGAERIFGKRREDMLGASVEILLPERFRSAHADFRNEFAHAPCVEGRMMGLRRVKGLRSDGVEIALEGFIANVQIGGQPVLITTLRDVTQSLAAEAEQQAMRKQLSQLTQRLMSQEKNLVKRVARALHDQLGQTMAAIRIVHETMATIRLQEDPAEVSRLENQLGSLIDQAIHQVRVVLTDLQPPMLDEHGLAAALDNELRNRARSKTSMQLVLQASSDVGQLRWPAAVEHAVFMIAREAVENAIRHSGASQLNLLLTGSATGLMLEIWDNGRGLPAKSEASAAHLGLTGIGERANSIGARVTLDTGAKGGAHLCLQWEAPQ